VLTTPPFPYDRKEVEEAVGLPVFLDEATVEDSQNMHFGEVGLSDNILVTSGCYGWTMVVTGTGLSIVEAQRRALRVADKIKVPNLRYRRDIGDRLVRSGWAKLQKLGWVPA
jgi:phosphoribosylamine--glycine ligase